MRKPRYPHIIAYPLFIMIILIFTACSDSDKPTEPTPVDLIDGAAYFPAEQGDIWYYTLNDTMQITRAISGDTTVNGLQCLRVMHNDTTKEAWQITPTTFLVHLLSGNIRFSPPLSIPFEMSTAQPHNFSSNVYIFEDPNLYEDHTHGSLHFRGYLTDSVPAGLFDSAIDLYYDVIEPADQYHEYYGKGVGLLDNGELVLDSAFVGGVWYRP